MNLMHGMLKPCVNAEGINKKMFRNQEAEVPCHWCVTTHTGDYKLTLDFHVFITLTYQYVTNFRSVNFKTRLILLGNRFTESSISFLSTL